MDSFEPIRKAAEDLHHEVAGQGMPKKPMELINAAIVHLKLELTWLPTGDPALKGAPSDHTINVREVRLCAGAEFIVMVCGDIMTMPGLPKVPSSVAIDVDESGKIVGLF